MKWENIIKSMVSIAEDAGASIAYRKNDGELIADFIDERKANNFARKARYKGQYRNQRTNVSIYRKGAYWRVSVK
jgi:hypothetical protein